ncbi:hypothetical protein Q765_20730 [Flavobacterium rivuli WB 3.3-2 = DSM 21788]|uniref:Uncharacterized protein n=2 Tax=Flavobacterium rivuli TaxID=498301 RepID=A0A0A2LX84_9FLAO|nr:hypothetical protein Q765_20730 [Flavobacterium rivuli WB 3.3-2 = DSM 21788]
MASWGQLTLPAGTSYTQDFNSIGSGLPEGWTVRTSAGTSALGTEATFVTTARPWSSTTGGFANYASSESTVGEGSSTNRALGTRQTGSIGDPGAAFVLQLANTTGKASFSLALKHQVLSDQPRTTTWRVQYCTNAAGTSWSDLGTYATSDGFGSVSATYTLPAAFNNVSTNVYIRVVTLVGSTGSGNRDTYGIDDFVLSWSPLAAPTINSALTDTSVFGVTDTYQIAAVNSPTSFGATNLPTGATVNSSGLISFATTVVPGEYNITITATNSLGTDTKTLVYTRNKANQAITNFNNVTKTYGDANFNLTSTAGASGQPVTYTILNENIATIATNTVTLLAPGTTTITANQAGTANYNAATPVDRTLTVNRKTLTVSGTFTALSKEYDGTDIAALNGTPVLGGIVGSDAVTLNYTSQFVNAAVGNGKQVRITYTLTGIDAAKYNAPATNTTLVANITPKNVTISGIAISDKDYDATNTATITGTPVLAGVAQGEDVVLNSTNAVAQFTSIQPGTDIPVTVTGYTIAGTAAGNYILQQPQGLTADINETGLANQTITFNALTPIMYGDTNVSLTATSTSGLPISYTSSNDAIATISGNTITATGVGTVTITATQEGDATHNPAIPVTQELTVNKRQLTITNAAVSSKVYDGNDTATAAGSLNNIVGNDDVALSSFAFFETKNVNDNIPVYIEYALIGTSAANYTLAQPDYELTGNITPKALTINNAAAQNKVYDGTAAAVITGTLAGVVNGDAVTLSGTGTFASVDVASGIEVTSNSLLTGAQAGNYTLTQPTGLSANITPKLLTVTATAQNKVYDRTITATVSNGVIASGIVEGDDVSLASDTVAGTFNDFTVANNKPVTALFILQGADAANYSVASQSFSANITPAVLTVDVTNAAVTTKVYNATAAATITGAVLNGVIDPDNVTVTASFTTFNAGTNIPVNITLSGTNAGSYTVQQPATALTGTITKKGLTATADNKSKNQGAANPALTITYGGFISGQNQTNAAGFVAPSITTSATTASPVGAYPITLTGGQATNYEFTSLTNGILLINSVATTGSIWANAITGSNPNNSNPYTSGEGYDDNITVSGIGRSSGISGSNANNRYNTTGWNTAQLDAQKYFTLKLTPNAGYMINLSSFVYNSQTSGSGPAMVAVRSSIDGFVANIGSPTSTQDSQDANTITLSASVYQNVTTAIEFRIYAWGTGTGTYSVNDFTFNGTVVAAPTAPVVNSALTDTSVINTTDTYQITATGTPVITYSTTNLPLGATINTTGLISFDGTTPAGTYNIGITATSYYGTNTKTLAYTVTKLNQVLSFDPDPIPTKYLGDAPFLFEYHNTASLPVTWSSANQSVATIAEDGTVTITGVGTTTLTASNTGNATYNPVSTGRTLTVLARPVIDATPSPMSISVIEGRGASQPVQLTNITAANLLPAAGNITLTVSEHFQIIIGAAAYAQTGSIPYTAGGLNLNNPEIYVRLAAGQLHGTYTGTLTITGGGATKVVPLNGIVEEAPFINTIAAAYGPYCQGEAAAISVQYTGQGTFGTGSFYVQHSDAAGVFPEDFSNIISAAAANSPIAATLPASFVTGNYRVRVVHLSSSLLLTKSTNNNGSDIVINKLPTLSGVSNTQFCGTSATLHVTGLLANATFTVEYTVNHGSVRTVAATANALGSADLIIAVTPADDNKELEITRLTRTDITPGCTSQFTVDNKTQLMFTENMWTGNEDTNWNNGNNWSCNEVPTINTPVVIAPSVNAATVPQGIVYSKTLVVQANAALIVTTGNTLYVNDKVTVDTNGTLTVQNNAALIQGEETAVNTNVGAISAVKAGNTLYRYDYTLWSSPVSGTQTLSNFSELTVATRFYEYGFSGDANYYIAVPGSTTFTPAKSYLIRMPDTNAAAGSDYYNGITPVAFTGTFAGTPNNGTVTIPASVQGSRFTAVGNPYPSPISVEAFFDGNEGVINEASGLYFWRKKNNANASSYATLTLAAFTANDGFENDPVSGGGEDQAVFFPRNEVSSWLISQGQGFFVKTATNPTGSNITFTNSMRRPSPGADQAFFRTAQNNNSRYWLNLKGTEAGFSQVAVAYMDNATLGLDYGYDGRQFSDGGNVTFYSLAEDTRLSIQARPEFAPADIVPMGFKAVTTGEFTVSIDHKDGLFEQGQDIYLKDNLLDVYHDLGESGYTFTSEAGTFNDRFEVVYTTDALGTKTPQLDPNSVIVYKQGTTININSGTAEMTGVTIYDVRGRKLYSNDKINATKTAINSLEVAQEVLIIEINTVKGKVSKRIVF